MATRRLPGPVASQTAADPRPDQWLNRSSKRYKILFDLDAARQYEDRLPYSKRLHTYIVVAWLTGAHNVHGGSFSYLHKVKNSLQTQVQDLLNQSPGLCACLGTSCSLHVMHDQANVRFDHSELRLVRGLGIERVVAGVVLHAFAPNHSVLANDLRFLHALERHCPLGFAGFCANLPVNSQPRV